MNLISWKEAYRLAEECGSKWPNVLAAQWALESGWGKHVSGKHNYFGIKGTSSQPHTTKYTKEQDEFGNEYTVLARFRDFETPKDCVQTLVNQWYKDYKQHKGVNRAKSEQECANLLVVEGYATDTQYAEKLGQLIKEHGIKATPQSPPNTDVTPFILNAAKYYRDYPHQQKAFLDLWHSLTDDQRQQFIKQYRSAPAPEKKVVPPYYWQRDNTIKPEESCQSAAIAMRLEVVRPELFRDDNEYLHAVQKIGRSEVQSDHQKVLTALGVNANFSTNGTRSVLLDLLDEGYQVPMGILHKGHYSQPSGGGHWILAYNHNDTGLICHDPYGLLDAVYGGYPARGPTDGKSVTYKWQHIIPRWDLGPGNHGWYWLID